MTGSRHRIAFCATMTLLSAAGCEDASPTPFPVDSGADVDATTDGAGTDDAPTDKMSQDTTASDGAETAP